MRSPTNSEAVIPVFDETAAINAVVTIAKLSESINIALQDLSAYSHIPEVVAVVSDLQRLALQLTSFYNRLVTRIDYWTNAQLPQSSLHLWIFRRDSRWLCHASSQDALGLQGMIGDLAGIIQSLVSLVGSVGQIVGVVSGSQASQGILARLNAAMGTLTGMQSSMHSASLCNMLLDDSEKLVIGEMAIDMYDNWGAYTPP